MSDRWIWAIRYAVVIVLALVLAAALGEMDLFKTTRIGKSGFNAARLVQFLGFGGALLVFWLLAQRAALLIEGKNTAWALLKSVLLPVATLIVVGSAHAIALLILGPLMNKTWLQVYNWIFILAIVLSAAWLVFALFTGSSSLAPLFGKGRRSAKSDKG
ncbi:MAG: hypothetical protein OEO84_02110 [Betaproteobacteria bacterium]|nr:hypothetical protein [Betaproteobacteria bacterium]